MKTIRGKIMMLTASITFLITIITVSICFYVFQSFLMKNQLQSAEFNLQLVSNNVSGNINDIIYLTKWCGSNSEIRTYLEEFEEKGVLAVASKVSAHLKPLALATYKRMKEEYYNTNSSDYITRMIIATNNRKNYLQVIMADNNYPNAADIVASVDYFSRLHDAAGFEWIGFRGDAFSKVHAPQILPIVRPIYDNYNSRILGWAYLSISSNVVTDYLKSYPLADDSILYLTIADQMYELKDGQFTETVSHYTVLSELTGTTIHPNTKAQTVRFDDGRKRTLLSSPMGIDGWYLSQVLSEQQFMEQKQVYLILIGAICLIIFSLGIALTIFMNRIISQPVDRIQKKIDDISHGDFSKDPEIEWEHELGKIGKGINHLSENVVSLMNKRVDDEKQKKDLEYQILQSQINPHFLYNTLNSIKWMATIQHADGIAEMTTALARLMKNVAKGSSALISLKEELELVADYFLIQQYRYGGSIHIEYRIESEELYHCSIHRFSLQPIIENALFHGIEPKGLAGTIVVEAKAIPSSSLGKNLQISITDDGIGMSEETIAAVMLNDNVGKADFFKQVGIQNVNQRIQYDFGSSYGITITSQPSVFTTMTILIPYLNNQES